MFGFAKRGIFLIIFCIVAPVIAIIVFVATSDPELGYPVYSNELDLAEENKNIAVDFIAEVFKKTSDNKKTKTADYPDYDDAILEIKPNRVTLQSDDSRLYLVYKYIDPTQKDLYYYEITAFETKYILKNTNEYKELPNDSFGEALGYYRQNKDIFTENDFELKEIRIDITKGNNFTFCINEKEKTIYRTEYESRYKFQTFVLDFNKYLEGISHNQRSRYLYFYSTVKTAKPYSEDLFNKGVVIGGIASTTPKNYTSSVNNGNVYTQSGWIKNMSSDYKQLSLKLYTEKVAVRDLDSISIRVIASHYTDEILRVFYSTR